MRNKTADCPECGEQPTIGYTRTVACDNCYDGAPDAGPQLIGSSWSGTNAAIDDWNEKVEEYIEEHAG